MIESLRYALTKLDSQSDGIAIVAFAGDLGSSRSAWIEAEVTNNYAVAAEALERIRVRGPLGRSCVSCGIEVGSSAFDTGRGDSEVCASMTVITDGAPTLPYGPIHMKKNLEVVRKTVSSLPDRTRMAFAVLDNSVYPSVSESLEGLNVTVESPESPESLAEILVKAARACKP
jgi:hypothetical protein